MDLKNRVSTKPIDRGMLKALCRYLDKFWQPESAPADEVLRPQVPHVLEAPRRLDDAPAIHRLEKMPPKKQRPFFLGVGLAVLPKLREKLLKTEETCSQRLLRMIRERGLEEVEVYTQAGVDRKLFSKMRRKDYHPKVTTLYAFIIVLQLNLDDATDLLASAGYAFSPANRLDMAVRFFVEHGGVDLPEVNDALYELGLEPLP